MNQSTFSSFCIPLIVRTTFRKSSRYLATDFSLCQVPEPFLGTLRMVSGHEFLRGGILKLFHVEGTFPALTLLYHQIAADPLRNEEANRIWFPSEIELYGAFNWDDARYCSTINIRVYLQWRKLFCLHRFLVCWASDWPHLGWYLGSCRSCWDQMRCYQGKPAAFCFREWVDMGAVEVGKRARRWARGMIQ